jgi:hypothetical protein
MHRFLLIEPEFDRKKKQSRAMHIMACVLLAAILFMKIKHLPLFLSFAIPSLFIILITIIFLKKLPENKLLNFAIRLYQIFAIGLFSILTFQAAQPLLAFSYAMTSVMILVTLFYEWRLSDKRFLVLKEEGLQFSGRKPQSVTWNQVTRVIFSSGLVSISLKNDTVVQKGLELPQDSSFIEVLNQFCEDKIKGSTTFA